ncbi:thrombospondin type 3 repeat-containing protein [Massilia aurea]|uniref:thrombospondin type 3 repeat-containing protein n=1 Tax=Massilia aurea TaxID=373040 RepID=UPI003461E980
MKSPLILAALIAIGAAATIPLSAQAQPHVSVVISNAPPPPIYERVPGPRHGHVWAPGYWEWRGHRHDWVRGHYVVARPGYVYAPPSWHHRGNRWVMEPSRWNRGPGRHYGPAPVYVRGHDGYDRDRGYRDRDRYHGNGNGNGRGRGPDFDRDGIPNHRDRDRDNDGVRNHHDRDRDGDGVRNRHDRRPDNPYRR